MPPITIPYAQPGVASFELTDDYLNQHLLRGSDPKLSPAISGEAGATIRRFEAVGFDSSGDIVPAVWHATYSGGGVRAIGIATNAAAAGERVLFWTTGHFNQDMILFHTSFDTPEKCHMAFFGAPTPTAIRLDPRFPT